MTNEKRGRLKGASFVRYGIAAVHAEIDVFANNYCIPIIETEFAEQFYASHRMRTEHILLKFQRVLA